MILLRKNRIVEKMLVDQRGIIKTDQVKLPPNAQRITGVQVMAQLVQAIPAGTVIRYYFGPAAAAAPSANMIVTLSTGTFDGTSLSVEGNAGAGQYLYYAHPIFLNNPTFNFGGFVGGFINWETETLVTPEGQSTFRIWRSTNANLGDVTVHIVH